MRKNIWLFLRSQLSSTSSQKTLNESFSFKVQPYSPLASPSALKPTVQYSPLASPSSTSSTLPPSPIAFPSPSNLLSPTYNPSAAFSPRNTSLFPVSKKPAPLLADMPPFRNPGVGQSSGHVRLTSPATPLEQRKSTSLADAKSPPFSSVEKNSPTQQRLCDLSMGICTRVYMIFKACLVIPFYHFTVLWSYFAYEFERSCVQIQTQNKEISL